MVATRPRQEVPPPPPPVEMTPADAIEHLEAAAPGPGPDEEEKEFGGEGDDPLDDPAPDLPEGYQSLDTAPKTGKRIVLLSSDGKTQVAVWRHSRQFKKGKWQSHMFWADPMNSWKPITFSPIGWKEETFECLV